MSVFAELKRRKLVQWTLGYAAGAWVLLQAIGFMVESYDWPHTVSRVAIVVALVGFLVTLVLAWFHGDRGAQRLSRNETLLLGILLAIGGGLAWRTAHAPITTALTTGNARASADAATNPHSIAVLPFINMSGDRDNAYLSDGISEEILNVLAQIPGLQVAARTSSFAFKDGREEVPEIAKELNVRLVLEGSVRKQGERVRITAQLIDASSGFHVWSQTYDRDLKDIFVIQDEIAKAIAEELKVKMGGTTAAVASNKGTRNVHAHDSYLRGLALWQARGEDNLWQALRQFEQSAAADPQFAGAYAGQAMAYVILPDWSARISYDESLGKARDNAERALSLDPTLPEPYIVLGYLADGERRRETAQALYGRAIVLRPSFASAYQWLGNSLWGGGQLDAGVAALERASVLDPRSAIIANNHGMALIARGRPADAKALCAPILKLAPDNHSCLESTAFAEFHLGDLSAAQNAFAGYATVTNPGAQTEVGAVFDALQGHGDRHAMAVRLAGFLPQSSNDPKSGNAFQAYVIPSLLVRLGEPQLALANLKAWAYTDRAGQSEWAVMMPALGQLHCDPGFVALVRKIKTVDPHYATLCTGKA